MNIIDIIAQDAAKNTTTWNGAPSNSTTGSHCLDYWSKCGTYRGRTQDEVNADMQKIFYEDEIKALKVVFGLRLVTRKVKTPFLAPGQKEFLDTKDTQTGYGQRDEFFKAVRWLAINKSELLLKNLIMIPVVGSWKDFFSEDLLDALSPIVVFELVRLYAKDPLLRKYLPTMHSKGKKRGDLAKKKSDWAKKFCSHVKISHKQYRELKKSGKAHTFQRQMSQGDWANISFNEIPGRAISHLTNRKGKDGKMAFERHGQLDRFETWVLGQDKIKFNGYPYELTTAASHSKAPSSLQKKIYNRQFEQLLEPFKGHKLGNVFCALDTSGSMNDAVVGPTTALQVCLSMGLVFSCLNTGWFKDTAVHFGERSNLIRFNASDDFVTRLHFLETMATAWGSTNFQSVIDLIIGIRMKHPEIPIEQFPETLLVLSDMQFNDPGVQHSSASMPTQSYYSNFTNAYGQRMIITPQMHKQMYGHLYQQASLTNHEVAKQKLASVGLGDLRIIWWQLNGNTTDFPAQMNDKGTYMIGGFDPVNLKALMGLTAEKKDFVATAEVKQQTPMDGMNNFLSQEIFGLLKF